MDRNGALEYIKSVSDEKTKAFTEKIVPGARNVLGAKFPDLRKMAKRIANEDYKSFLDECRDEYFEEIMLKGMVIGYIKADFSQILAYISDFLPHIDNWAVCDSFCGGLKVFSTNQDGGFEFLKGFKSSQNPWKLRFLLTSLLGYYVNDEFIDRVLEIALNVKSEHYYVKMAQAWLIAECFIKYREKTEDMLKSAKLDKWVFNKAMQKVRDSRRVDAETKKNLPKYD